MSGLLTRDLSLVRTHSVPDAGVAQWHAPYPVVLMRAGLAALTTDYTCLAEDLASHGYIVAGFDAPYRTIVVVRPDGKVIARAPENNADLVAGAQQEALATNLFRAWTADMSFALDRLAQLNATDPRFRGRLDFNRVGAFGHSLGGATTLQFCHDDPRCKAGADIDGAPLGTVATEGVTQPFLFILGDHSHEPAAETGPVLAHIHAIYDRLPPGNRLLLQIPGANHFQFSDFGLVKSRILIGAMRKTGIIGIDAREQISLTRSYLRHFFDSYLKPMDGSLLK